jgi:hypothetical protein
VSTVTNAPAPIPPRDTPPCEAVTQAEANALTEHFDLQDVDHIQVSWVDGHRGKQALLWPIKSRWLGYVMVFLLLLSRGTRPILDPPMPGDPVRPRRGALTALVSPSALIVRA